MISKQDIIKISINADTHKNKVTELQWRLQQHSIYTTNLKAMYQRQFNETKLEISQKDFHVQIMQNKIYDKDAEISWLKQKLEALLKNDDLEMVKK